MKPIGILGGTFNPPHMGHLLIAEHVRDKLELEEVWFIPTNTPPHKKLPDVISIDHRLKMLEMAIKDNIFFKLDPIEANRIGKSYTIDTIRELKNQNPNHDYYFIIGGDMVEYLPKWYKIDELINYLTFVGVKRKGYQLETSYPVIEIDLPIFDVSSTDIRNRIATGNSIKYLVPNEVHSYIKELRLYE